jgi:hypothetical protein
MFESTATRDTVAIVSLSALGLLAGMMLGIFIAGYAARGLPAGKGRPRRLWRERRRPSRDVGPQFPGRSDRCVPRALRSISSQTSVGALGLPRQRVGERTKATRRS